MDSVLFTIVWYVELKNICSGLDTLQTWDMQIYVYLENLIIFANIYTYIYIPHSPSGGKSRGSSGSSYPTLFSYQDLSNLASIQGFPKVHNYDQSAS